MIGFNVFAYLSIVVF